MCKGLLYCELEENPWKEGSLHSSWMRSSGKRA